MYRKMQYCLDVSSPNLFYRFNTTLIKTPSYFVDIYKLVLKFIWRGKRHRIDNTILKEDNKVGELTLRDFKIYYEATVNKTVCIRKNIEIDQRNSFQK